MNRKDKIKQAIIRAFHIFPIQRRTIFCHNFYGNGYDENPKYIAEEIRKRKGYKVYWVLSRPNANLPLPDGVERVIVGTPKYFYAIATSKIWISNVRLPLYFIKRKNQYYLQTWHGDLGMKKIEYDVADKLSETYLKQMELDNNLIDFFTSGSKHFTNLIHHTFKYDGEIVKLGLPKHDPLINSDHETEKRKFKKKLSITEDNILLYMPTFRADYSSDPFNIDLDKVKSALEQKTHHTWKIVSKMHPNVPNEHKTIHSKDYLSIDNYGDVQNAIIASDLLISDYSSVSFDAMLANRPAFIYANDEKAYTKNERGLYFKLADLPFPSFTTTDELIKYVKKISLNDMLKKYKAFVSAQEVVTTGTSSKDITDFIIKKMQD